MKFLLFLSLMFVLSVVSFGQTVKSPDGKLTLEFKLNDEGTPVYGLSFKEKEVVKESRLGIELQNSPNLT